MKSENHFSVTLAALSSVTFTPPPPPPTPTTITLSPRSSISSLYDFSLLLCSSLPSFTSEATSLFISSIYSFSYLFLFSVFVFPFSSTCSVLPFLLLIPLGPSVFSPSSIRFLHLFLHSLTSCSVSSFFCLA